MNTLDQQLLAAHCADDRPALVTLYAKAADQSDDKTAAGFYLTHAYIYALELGDPRAADLCARLRAEGREE